MLKRNGYRTIDMAFPLMACFIDIAFGPAELLPMVRFHTMHSELITPSMGYKRGEMI